MFSDISVSWTVFVWVKRLIWRQGQGCLQLKKQFVVRIKQDKMSIRFFNVSPLQLCVNYQHALWRKVSSYDRAMMVHQWYGKNCYCNRCMLCYRILWKVDLLMKKTWFCIKCSCAIMCNSVCWFSRVMHCFYSCTAYARSDCLGETRARYCRVKGEVWLKREC